MSRKQLDFGIASTFACACTGYDLAKNPNSVDYVSSRPRAACRSGCALRGSVRFQSGLRSITPSPSNVTGQSSHTKVSTDTFISYYARIIACLGTSIVQAEGSP
jgi:hypothetical protein